MASKQTPQLRLHQQRATQQKLLSSLLQGKHSLTPLPQQGEGQGRGAEVSFRGTPCRVHACASLCPAGAL